MLELDKFINDLNDFFAESDNAFHVLETHFLNFFVCYSQSSSYRHDALLSLMLINIFSTFLSLEYNGQNKNPSPDP